MITKAKKIREEAQDNPCSPEIWRKFNPREKKLWLQFYNSFLDPMNFTIGWDEKDKKIESMREVTAHNMACRAVWTLQEK